MADGTKIEWSEATWNPITGCSVVSPGCTNCYAMRLAGTRLAHHPSRKGLTRDAKAGPVWTGEVRFNEQWLDQPLRWRRPRLIFVCAHSDLFGEAVPDEWIDRVFAVMALAPQHVFQVLTKRPERMRRYLTSSPNPAELPGRLDAILETMRTEFATSDQWSAPYVAWPLPNVWLGTSVEDQTRADERIPILLDTPAAVRWLSAEPLLGPLDLTCVPWPPDWARPTDDISDGVDALRHTAGRLSWIVIGGESGPDARPMDLAWARSLVEQCRAAGIPAFMKQLGAAPYRTVIDAELGAARPIPIWFRDRKGGAIEEWPEDLRVREWPRAA